MDWLSGALNGLFDLLFAPFGDLRWPGLLLVSALSGVLLLWLFKLVTPQRKLARARGRLMGHLYELGLFQDDLGTLMRVQRDFALANLRYLAHALPALVVLVPLVGLILVQLEARLQHPPLDADDTFLVAATVDEDHAALLTDLVLEPGPGLALDTLPVRDPRARTAWWRVRVVEPGWSEVAVADGAGGRWTKQVKAAAGLRRYTLSRERGSLWSALANPAEAPLPADAAVLRLAVEGPAEPEWFAQAWFWVFCAVSVVAGVAVKGLLKVEL